MMIQPGILGPAGGAAGGPIGAILGALASLFGALVGGDGGLGAAVKALTNSIVSTTQMLLGILQRLYEFLLAFVKKLIEGLKFLWENFFKKLLTKLGNAIIKMHQWLEEHLAPVVKFLAKVKKYLDRIYLRYIRPYLQMIQHVRRFLLILRLLHINFAVVLDRKLAQIEGTIAHVFLEIRGILNNVIDIVNALANPPKLARLIAATMGGRQVFAGMTRLWTGLPVGHFFPNYAATAPPWEKPVTRAADITDPLHNPPASALLSSLSLASFFTPAEGDPIPSDVDIDASSNTYISGQVLRFLQQAEAAAADASAFPLDPLSGLQLDAGFVNSDARSAAKGIASAYYTDLV